MERDRSGFDNSTLLSAEFCQKKALRRGLCSMMTLPVSCTGQRWHTKARIKVIWEPKGTANTDCTRNELNL